MQILSAWALTTAMSPVKSEPMQTCWPTRWILVHTSIDHTIWIQAIAATIPFPGDSEYISASNQCLYNFDPDSCASKLIQVTATARFDPSGKENCVWDIPTETCELTAVAYTDIIIRAAGNDTTDPICAQLEYTASTGCIDIHDENACSSKSECFFSDGSNALLSFSRYITVCLDCDVTVSAIELAAVADKPGLADQIVNLNFYCGSFADKKTCTAWCAWLQDVQFDFWKTICDCEFFWLSDLTILAFLKRLSAKIAEYSKRSVQIK